MEGRGGMGYSLGKIISRGKEHYANESVPRAVANFASTLIRVVWPVRSNSVSI